MMLSPVEILAIKVNHPNEFEACRRLLIRWAVLYVWKRCKEQNDYKIPNNYHRDLDRLRNRLGEAWVRCMIDIYYYPVQVARTRKRDARDARKNLSREVERGAKSLSA